MISVLQGELYRIRKSRLYFCCIVISLFFTMGLVMTYSYDYVRVPEKAGQVIVPSLTVFTQFIFKDFSLADPLLLFLTIYITNDFRQALYPALLSKGISRYNIFFGKLLSCFVAVVIYLAVNFTFAYTLIFTMWNKYPVIEYSLGRIACFLGIQTICFLAYTSFILMTCYLLRGRVITLIVNYGLLFVLYLYLTRIGKALDLSYPLYQYWIVGLSNRMQINSMVQYSGIIAVTIMTYFVICIGVAFYSFNHFDIKLWKRSR